MVYDLCDELRSVQQLKFQPPFYNMSYTRTIRFSDVQWMSTSNFTYSIHIHFYALELNRSWVWAWLTSNSVWMQEREEGTGWEDCKSL